jgi:hypothetical protein
MTHPTSGGHRAHSPAGSSQQSGPSGTNPAPTGGSPLGASVTQQARTPPPAGASAQQAATPPAVPAAFLTPALDDFWGNQIAEKAKAKVLAHFTIATVIVGVLSFLYGKVTIDNAVEAEIKTLIAQKATAIDQQIKDLMKPQIQRIDALQQQTNALTGEIASLKQETETKVREFKMWIIGSQQDIKVFADRLFHSSPSPSVIEGTVDWSTTIGAIIDTNSSAGEAATIAYALESELTKLGQNLTLSYVGLFYSAGGTDAGVDSDNLFAYLANVGAYNAADWPVDVKTSPGTIKPVVKITGFDSRNVVTSDYIISTLKRGKVPVAIIQMDHDFQQYASGIFKTPAGPLLGYHAVAVVGYDEGNRSIKIANSWGANWGEGGFARIDIDIFVARTLELYVIDDVRLLSH